MVAWQNILNCLNNLVYVLSGVGTESNINIGYRQLRQNLSHTRSETLLHPLDINISSNVQRKSSTKIREFIGCPSEKLRLIVIVFVSELLCGLVELSRLLILCCGVHVSVCLRWLSHGTRVSSDLLLDDQAKALGQP